MVTQPPAVDVDLFSDAAILEPYENYRMIRDAGAVVWLSREDMYAIGRYEPVVAALRNHQLFSSASGVAMDAEVNAGSVGTMIASDPPLHDTLRKIVAAPLTPSAVSTLRTQIAAAADELVDRLVSGRKFDAATDLAQHLPLTIVSHMVGLPEDARAGMLDYAAANFDLFGPRNARWEKGRPVATAMRQYVAGLAERDKVKAGSWADKLLDHIDAGTIPKEQFVMLLRDYLGPSLDTTIFATANLIALFAQYPEEWRKLREDPSLMRNAIEECVRLESPIRGFTRKLTRDAEIDGFALPEGSRVMLLYASANRDERKWQDPERFDISRSVKGHVGFGFGLHSCAGMHLARLEIECLLSALIPRVRSFNTGTPVRALNNILRGFASLPTEVELV